MPDIKENREKFLQCRPVIYLIKLCLLNVIDVVIEYNILIK